MPSDGPVPRSQTIVDSGAVPHDEFSERRVDGTKSRHWKRPDSQWQAPSRVSTPSVAPGSDILFIEALWAPWGRDTNRSSPRSVKPFPTPVRVDSRTWSHPSGWLNRRSPTKSPRTPRRWRQWKICLAWSHSPSLPRGYKRTVWLTRLLREKPVSVPTAQSIVCVRTIHDRRRR